MILNRIWEWIQSKSWIALVAVAAEVFVLGHLALNALSVGYHYAFVGGFMEPIDKKMSEVFFTLGVPYYDIVIQKASVLVTLAGAAAIFFLSVGLMCGVGLMILVGIKEANKEVFG